MSGRSVDVVGLGPNGDGSGYRIGDGFVLTAGHVVFEYNGSVTNPLVSTDKSIALDYRGYAAAYRALVDQRIANGTPSSQLEPKALEGNSAVYPHDSVVIAQSGKVGGNGDGLVLFLNPTDMMTLSSVFATPARIFRESDISRRSGSVTSASSGILQFSANSQEGESGGAYLLSVNGQDYVVGTNFGSTNLQNGVALGTYFTSGEWISINALLEAEQVGNVTNSEPSNMVVGTSGIDTIIGSYRADKLLGRGGNDTILDGESATINAWGDDTLIGGTGNDTLVGSRGNDTFWGGDESAEPTNNDGDDTVSYFSQSSNPIKITFDGSSDKPSITVKDNFGDSDTLHSIEEIIGTSGYDRLAVVGQIATGTDLTIDAAGGQQPNPKDSIDLSQATAKTHLVLDGSGDGYVSTEGGGQIDLVGFHTQVIGSNYDDTISDDSTGDKKIDGGLGNDTISVSQGDAILKGGDGDDSITGGSGNDILEGGAGMDSLYGGTGSDLLIARDLQTAAGRQAGDALGVPHQSGPGSNRPSRERKMNMKRSIPITYRFVVALGAALWLTPMANAEPAGRIPKDVVIPMTPDWPKKGDRIVKADKIRISRKAKFCVHTWFSPDMRKFYRVDDNNYQNFSYRVIDGGEEYFKNHKFPGDLPYAQIQNQFHRIPSEVTGDSAYCLNDGINVMLTSHVDINSKGEPYKVTLVARQKRNLWMNSIERLSASEWPAKLSPAGRQQWLMLSISYDISKLTVIFFEQHTGN